MNFNQEIIAATSLDAAFIITQLFDSFFQNFFFSFFLNKSVLKARYLNSIVAIKVTTIGTENLRAFEYETAKLLDCMSPHVVMLKGIFNQIPLSLFRTIFVDYPKELRENLAKFKTVSEMPIGVFQKCCELISKLRLPNKIFSNQSNEALSINEEEYAQEVKLIEDKLHFIDKQYEILQSSPQRLGVVQECCKANLREIIHPAKLGPMGFEDEKRKWYQSASQCEPTMIDRLIYLQEAAKGIKWMHTKKTVHNDIKPANLLLGEYDRIKVAGRLLFNNPLFLKYLLTLIFFLYDRFWILYSAPWRIKT